MHQDYEKISNIIKSQYSGRPITVDVHLRATMKIYPSGKIFFEKPYVFSPDVKTAQQVDKKKQKKAEISENLKETSAW